MNIKYLTTYIWNTYITPTINLIQIISITVNSKLLFNIDYYCSIVIRKTFDNIKFDIIILPISNLNLNRKRLMHVIAMLYFLINKYTHAYLCLVDTLC